MSTMSSFARVDLFSVLCLLLFSPLAGCIGADDVQEIAPVQDTEELDEPCLFASQSVVQSMTSITVNGQERMFRLSAPNSDAGNKLPLIIAFHGGGGAAEDFQQQNEFDQLAEQEKFIMAYAIAEDDRTAAEGEWFLNTAATSRADNDFSEAIVDELSKEYCIDQDRLYAIGYSLGSMYSYEIACQLNHRFAAVASFAGTMPVEPETCILDGSMAVMHIHGKLDYIIDYDDDWDWKDGEHENVGTMSSVPGMIDSWASRANCASSNTDADFFLEHITHSGCFGDTRIEHYGIELHEHTWPDEVDGTPTYQLIWQFLSDFTN
ncbi:MAG: dienelactone hydrolase family protein [Candidatus Poseidoniaceae archaeon]|nr:dienelactone hydrolase family protein [Candidatus Poseidoniaceae archaeon]